MHLIWSKITCQSCTGLTNQVTGGKLLHNKQSYSTEYDRNEEVCMTMPFKSSGNMGI